MDVDVNLVINSLKQQIADQAVTIAVLNAQLAQMTAMHQNYELEDAAKEDVPDGDRSKQAK